MALRLRMSTPQQTPKTTPQNGSHKAHRVNPSPKIASAAEKIPSKVCSFPAKELQVLGKDGPFHRERTEPLGETKVFFTPTMVDMHHNICLRQQQEQWAAAADKAGV